MNKKTAKEPKKWTHDELIDDLAGTFDSWNSVILSEVAAGSKWFQNAPVPDLFVMDKSYSRSNVRIFEVKASQADFRQDIVSQKWTRYLPLCDKFYFAIPNYIKWIDLVKPHGEIGVMIRGERGWKTVRRSNKAKREEQNEMFWQSLLFSGTKEIDALRNKETELQKQKRYKEDLEEILADIDGYHSVLDEELNKKLREYRDLKRQVDFEKDHIESEFVMQLKKTLNVESWGGNKFKDMLEDLIWKRMEVAGMVGVEELVKYLLGKDKEKKEKP